MTALQILLSLLVGATATSTVLYKLFARRVLLASTTQSKDALRLDPAPDGSSNKIVVVMGWGGAQMRHLKRLQDLYASKGYATVVVLPPMISYFENGGTVGLGAELLLVLREHMLKMSAEEKASARIFFHLHSNTSSFYYMSVMRVLKYDIFADIAKAYVGNIYDSTPGHPSLGKIAAPKAFADELNAFIADESNKFAAKPLLLRRSADLSSAAPVAGGADAHNAYDPIVALATPTAISQPLHLSSWRSDAFAKGNTISPFIWAHYAFLMAFVTTPLIIKRNQYFHWFWWPVSFLVIFKEYAHTALRILSLKNFGGAAASAKNNNLTSPAALATNAAAASADAVKDIMITRYGPLLSPNAVPSMAKVAELLAESETDGYFNNYDGALHHLYAVVGFDRMLNHDVEFPNGVPELFLYSDKDKMVFEKDNIKFIYARCASQYAPNQIPVIFVHKFFGSHHVAHLLKFPEDYSKCLDNFMTFALAVKEKEGRVGKSVMPKLAGGGDEKQPFPSPAAAKL